MRIGLISDTHGRLRPEVFGHFENVLHILHAGDIGSIAILDELRALATVTAVWGNTDGFELRSAVSEVAHVELGGQVITLVHGHQLGSPTPAAVLGAWPDADIVVFGHTHRPTAERVAGRLAVNPGAAGPARFRLSPSIALLTISAGSASIDFIDL